MMLDIFFLLTSVGLWLYNVDVEYVGNQLSQVCCLGINGSIDYCHNDRYVDMINYILIMLTYLSI